MKRLCILLALLGGSLVVLPDIAGAPPAKNTDRAQFWHAANAEEEGPYFQAVLEGPERPRRRRRSRTHARQLASRTKNRICLVGITTVDGLGTYAELRPCLYCAHDRPIVIAIAATRCPSRGMHRDPPCRMFLSVTHAGIGNFARKLGGRRRSPSGDRLVDIGIPVGAAFDSSAIERELDAARCVGRPRSATSTTSQGQQASAAVERGVYSQYLSSR